jgi:glutathione S-transferase
MWQLYQFPLCPFSRKVRLLMSEKSIGYELVAEHPWEMRDDFLDLNPAGRTPVLANTERKLVLKDSRAICEYLEETEDRNPLLGGTATYRAEIRRLVALFEEHFYGDVVAPLLHERMKKRLVTRESPNASILREAMRRANTHLDYLDYLVDSRSWLAGSTLSMADLAAAAQISVADYLGGIDWAGHNQAHTWYSVLKSRPSFRPLLADRMGGINPPKHYPDVDF